MTVAHNVLRIAVVFHPARLDLVDQSPAPSVCALQDNVDVLYGQSSLFQDLGNRATHLLWKSSLEEGVDLCSGPTADPEGERELESRPLVDEDWDPRSKEVARGRVRSWLVKLCFGRLILPTSPSAVKVLRNHWRR